MRGKTRISAKTSEDIHGEDSQLGIMDQEKGQETSNLYSECQVERKRECWSASSWSQCPLLREGALGASAEPMAGLGCRIARDTEGPEKPACHCRSNTFTTLEVQSPILDVQTG